METLHVITPCSRFHRLAVLGENFSEVVKKNLSYRIRWHVAFQNSEVDPCGAMKNNEIIDMIPAKDWIWILDDDNSIHGFFFTKLQDLFLRYSGVNEKKAFVFSQNRADALGPILYARPENMRVGGVDTAQLVFKKELLGPLRFCDHPKYPDGLLYEKLFQIHGESAFVFVNGVEGNRAFVNYNAFR